MNKIEIFAPRYHDRKVLIAQYKVGVNNQIVFTKAKHLKGMVFEIKGAQVERYPLESNGTLPCYAVPLEDLKNVSDKHTASEESGGDKAQHTVLESQQRLGLKNCIRNHYKARK